MPDWLNGTNSAEPRLAFQHLVLRLVAAMVLGVGVALVFQLSHGRTHRRSATLTTTLILLSMLIAMVSMVIGSSVALAFSLVGALSIVRFRTVVEDTRDTAFVIFAVVVGMAAGAGQLLIPAVGLPLIGVAAIVLSHIPNSESLLVAVLTVRLGLGRDPDQLLASVLNQHCESFRLVSASTTKQGSAIEVSYSVKLRSPKTVVQAVTDLNQIEGIQNVELRTE